MKNITYQISEVLTLKSLLKKFSRSEVAIEIVYRERLIKILAISYFSRAPFSGNTPNWLLTEDANTAKIKLPPDKYVIRAYFKKAKHACDMDKKKHFLVNLEQFEHETPLNSMQI